MVERAVILCEGKTLHLQHFPVIYSKHQVSLEDLPAGAEHAGIDLEQTLELIEKRLILTALEHAQDNKSRAAELLQISRQALYRKLNQLGLKAGENDKDCGSSGSQ